MLMKHSQSHTPIPQFFWWGRLSEYSKLYFSFLKQIIQVKIESNCSAVLARAIMGHSVSTYSGGGRELGGSVAGLRATYFVFCYWVFSLIGFGNVVRQFVKSILAHTQQQSLYR